MLVIFKSSASADITMFGDVARTLLKMMGQSGQIPGAIMTPDVVTALASLKSALDRVQPTENSQSDDEDTPVSLAIRAVPLIRLLEAAIEDKADVLWES